MSSVTFYNKDHYNGDSEIFNGTQRRSYSSSQSWESLQVDSTTWLVLYSGSNFTGNYLKVTSNIADLQDVPRGSDHNWNNDIASFIMYSGKPSWWDSGKPDSSDLMLGPNQAMFTSSNDFLNNCSILVAVSTMADLGHVMWRSDDDVQMNDSIDSIGTGSSCYLELWSDCDYKGDYLRIFPNYKYSKLSAIPRGSGSTWSNCISSIKLWNTKPDGTWNLRFDEGRFFGYFPNAQQSSDSSGTYYRYKTQGCDYDIRLTELNYKTDGSVEVSFRIDYDVTGTNDKVNLTVLVDSNNHFVSATYSYEAGGATQIPQSVIKAVDVTAEVLGMVGALETAGISEEAADSFIAAFDAACKIFNKVMDVAYKLSETDDGRYYIVGVCSHVVCKALNSIVTV